MGAVKVPFDVSKSAFWSNISESKTTATAELTVTSAVSEFFFAKKQDCRALQEMLQ